ncbi:MAG: hypothetical protein VYA51_01015 [Planctomycetota bacterium]|nr:hypothetical protein [Planctomycetota bacterium]
MSENQAPSSVPQPPTEPAPERPAERVIIRPWPKVVFLYPTFAASVLLCLLSGLGMPVAPETLGNTWMLVFMLNILIFSFDFSRIWSLVLVFAVALLVVLIFWLDLTGFVSNVLGKISITANTSFYGFMSAGLGLILLIVWINSRFHYYEVNAREILHHHGYLGDVQRWSTEGLEMNKEIYDVAEYGMLRSGRLIFNPMTSKKAIVIDNVVCVNRIEKAINDLLSHVAVRINQRPGPG